MSEQENLGVSRKIFEAYNAHDAERYAALLDEGHVWETDTLPAPAKGREAARQTMQMYFDAFPDLHFDIDSMIASGNYVITRWRVTGTHRGEFMGIPPTNRKSEVHGCSVAEFRNGKATHAWVYWDTGHLLRQLGVFSVPGQAAA